MIETGMILAAGLGTRMRHLTEDRPKPLIPVNGKPMIDHVIEKLQSEGAKNIVVNSHYKAEMLEAHLQQFDGLTCIREQQLLGQGGGIKNARRLLGDNPFFTTNSDALWTGNVLETLTNKWQQLSKNNAADGILLLMPTAKVASYTKAGDFNLDASGCISWRETGKTAPYLYTGIQLLHPRAFKGFDEEIFSLLDVYSELIKKNRLFGVVHSQDWFHLGTVEELAAATA